MLTPNPNVAYLYSLLAVVCFHDNEAYSPGKKSQPFLRNLSQLPILFLSLFNFLMLTRPSSVVLYENEKIKSVWLEPSPLPRIVSCRDNGRHFGWLSLLTECVKGAGMAQW